MIGRAHRRRHEPERDHRRRVTMRDTHDVGPRAINLAVEIALDERRPPTRIARLTIEGELHDVVGGHERRRKRPRHQEPLGIAGCRIETCPAASNTPWSARMRLAAAQILQRRCVYFHGITDT